jgi:hypothetical protein
MIGWSSLVQQALSTFTATAHFFRADQGSTHASLGMLITHLVVARGTFPFQFTTSTKALVIKRAFIMTDNAAVCQASITFSTKAISATFAGKAAVYTSALSNDRFVASCTSCRWVLYVGQVFVTPFTDVDIMLTLRRQGP